MNTINPGQIVYLECLDKRLYAEAIQVAGSVRLWCRPLMLVSNLPHDSHQQQAVIADAAIDPETCSLELFDLKTAPDLVWPLESFKMAFDTDFFALLFHLRIMDNSEAEGPAKQQFQHFLHSCWQHGTKGYDTPQAPRKLISIR
ncbi:hypothetical protein [Leptothoe kymatousa]|uniref:Uncharacterized protein n=1 Tax=Leptothoe kymatousa TAU-MAC 1615 TaxID=2364775 RepID=A0ABS5Y660_9CYAN|nr:hypothetical protein [Leptothoe kymatousa]MBT9313292.1 hypothetical protein [Leptothoe kymatousa TAU-MAC 1615]